MKDIVSKNQKNILGILLILVVLIGTSYAVLNIVKPGHIVNKLKVADLSLELGNEKNNITIEKSYPITDEAGKKTKTYEFSLTNNGDVPSNYKISLDNLEIDDDKTRMSDEYIKCRIQISGSKEAEQTKKLSEFGRVLDLGTLDAGESNSYILQVWMDYDAPNDAQGPVFKAKLNITGEQIPE